MPRKTIAEHAIDVLRETDNPAVMWGDAGLLDMIAARAGVCPGKCGYTTENHPLVRWKRVLDALERSPLFVKSFAHAKPGMPGNQVVRLFRPAVREAAETDRCP